MAVQEVGPENQSNENPYRAIIGTETDYYQGRIRIEPPVHFGDTYLDDFEPDRILLRHDFTDTRATILNFVVHEWPENGDSDEVRIVETVRTMLGELGLLAMKSLFEAEWATAENNELI